MRVDHAYLLDPDERRRAIFAKRLSRLAVRVEMHDGFKDGILEPHESEAVLFVAGEAADPILQRLRNAEAMWPVIVYAEQPGASDIVHAIESGALDFLEWPISRERLKIAVERVANKSDLKMRELRQRFSAKVSVDMLSGREFDVLLGMVAGKRNKEIGRELKISPRTVEIHRGNLLAKLNAGASADVIRLGVYAGLDSKLDLPLPGSPIGDTEANEDEADQGV